MKVLFLNKLKNKIISKLSSVPFINNHFSGIATIFMLHRVHPFESHKLDPNENMKVSPEFLEKFIVDLKSKGYEFISLDRLHQILKNGEKTKKEIIFTLDDGYKDNYEIAYPIFKKHKVPFTIYVTTSLPENDAILWWYIIEDLINNNDEIKLTNYNRFYCRSKIEKIETFLKIREIIISFDPSIFKNRIKELFENYQIDWYSKCNELALNWEEIKLLSKDNLVTIGGHTSNHYALNRLSNKDIAKEIVIANKLIESKINMKVEHFSYPFGSRNEIGQREFDLLKNYNFKTVTTTRDGNIFNKHKDYLECLPRIMLTENFKIKCIGNIRFKKMRTI